MSKSYNIAVIPGDATGPEIIKEACKVLEAVSSNFNFKLEFVTYPFGGEHYLRTDELLPESAIEEFKESDGILLGVLGHAEVKSEKMIKGILMGIRWAMDQYIYLRPIKLYPGVPTPLKKKGPEDIDFVVVRENTGGLYSGIGGASLKGTPNEVAVENMVYSRMQVERCLKYAFEYNAYRNTKKPLVLCGKSSVLTNVYGLWERVFNEIGEQDYPNMKRRYYHVDELCMLLLKSPEMFDVIVAGNMFGDILADIGAILQGGIGVAAGGNINPAGVSMFSPIGGDFSPDVWGETLHNPFSAIQAGAMLLENLGEQEAAERVDMALMGVAGTQLPGVGASGMGFAASEIGDMVAERV